MIKKNLDAKVRPLSNTSLEKASLLGASRIYVSKDSLISLTGNLENGKHCLVERLDDQQETLKREASLYILPEKNLSPNVVMMTRAFQEATGFKLGDQVRISLAGVTPEAVDVVMEDLSEGTSDLETKLPPSPEAWAVAISHHLDRAEVIFPGMIFEGVTIGKLRKSYKVTSIDGLDTNLRRFAPESAVRVQDPESEEGAVSQSFGGELTVTGVPGLSHEIAVLNDFLEGFSRPFIGRDEYESCGFVIHGGRGTGKTFILKQIAKANWGKPWWIKGTDKLTTIRDTFKLAQSQRPSLIFIDGLDDLLSKDRSNRDAIIETIGDELDSLSAEGLRDQALPQVVVIATCSDYMIDVPPKLQKRERFGDNIALHIPAAPERFEILKFHNPPIKAEETEKALRSIAQKTHAYNGDDLARLVRNSWKMLRSRLREEGADLSSMRDQSLTQQDMERAMNITRASAMHDINLKPPTIHWQDVGGQEALKKILSRMIRNTKNNDPSFRKVLPHPPKGLLLYGPPGCSKTLSAQAMATESGFNFFAVKGAELLNMYVGESERAVRTLFERARRASPSIIFFDEIDSIGGQRTGPGASRGASSVNMLTTLLTEMDGFETLTGVLILAATNRPEAMDPALMRPGRFDQILYVGPPDLRAREAVFNVHLQNLSLAADIDIAELARLADGYSGAEIKAICSQAGAMAQERYDEAAEQGNMNEALEIRMADLVRAIEVTPRNITKSMVEGYEKWSRQFKKVP